MDMSRNQNRTNEDLQLVRKDGQAYHLQYGMSFIGREECDIMLQSHSADKRHAVIFYDSGDKEVRIKDLNSTSGTYVNSIRIPEQSYVKLNHLDSVRFGFGPDLFYIQKIAPPPSLISPTKKKFPETPIVNILNETTDGDINVKNTVESTETLTEQDNSKENESVLSLHDADSLEDITQPLPGPTTPSSSPVISEKPDQSPSVCFSGNKCIKESRQFVGENTKIEPYNKINAMESPPEEKDLATDKNREENRKPLDTSMSSDKGADTSESSPIAMAFTIAFDNDITATRKKLNIKDSISQYAPRKTESERSPSQKLRPGKLTESCPKKVLPLDLKDVPVSSSDGSKRWIHEKVKQCEQSVLHEPSESTLWDLASKQEQKEKTLQEGKLSDAATFLIQKMLNGEPKLSIPSPPPVTTIENSPPRITNWTQNWNNNKNQMDGILKSPIKISPEQRRKSPEEGTIVQKEIDDKSETGTYTVDTDQNDPVVEEARQKIDEIFGVHKTANKASSHPTGRHNNNWNEKGKEKQIPCFNEQNLFSSKSVTSTPSAKHPVNDVSSSEGNLPWSKAERSAQRPKRRLPTPPVPKQLDASVSDGHVDHIGTHLGHYPLSLVKKDKVHRLSHNSNQEINRQLPPRQDSAPNPNTTSFYISSDVNTDRRTRFIDNTTPSQKVTGSKTGLIPLCTATPGHVLFDNRNDSQTWNSSALQDSCQNGDEDSLDGTTLSQYTPSDTRSEGSPQAKTPQNSSGLWRRIPWNLSTSDLELNRSKSETASVISDLSTSTEPSSLSSQYSKGKSDSAPPMRLNRAFALRRARLGIESDSATTVINKSGSKENVKKQSSSNSKSSSNLNPTQLSRQDGGRFSLRLPRKANTKSSKEKSCVKSNENKKCPSNIKSTIVNKNGHRRIDSDPGKPNIHWKKMDVINDTINSDVEVSQIPILSSPKHKLQSFHRSASFNGSEELLCANDISSETAVHKNAERPNQLPKSSICKLRKYNKTETTNALGISPGWQHSSLEEKESEKIVPQSKGSPQQPFSSSKRELSALDSLVISAIHQLSVKLRTGARCLLEKERQKHTEKSDIRLMIEEVLPQVVEKKSNTQSEGNLTRDLSSILKNLKRVEQSLEVLSSLADYDNQTKSESNKLGVQKFFVVNV